MLEPMKLNTFAIITSLLLAPVLSAGTGTGYTLVGCFNSAGSAEFNGTDIYMSSSECSQYCSSSSVFAMHDGNQCYCGSEIPSSTASVSASECSSTCVGYPSENCGSDNDWSFYYMNAAYASGLVSTASGSASATGSSASLSASGSSSRSASASASSASVSGSSSSSASSVSSSSGSSVTSSVSSGGSSTSSSSASETSSAFRVTTVTNGGGTATVTVSAGSSTSTPTDTSATSKAASGSGGVSKGAIAGIVIGVVGGLAILGAGLFLLWRRKQEEDDESGPDPFKDPFGHEPKSAFTQKVDQRLNPAMLGAQQRISVGSLDDEVDYSRKILRVANPDATA